MNSRAVILFLIATTLRPLAAGLPDLAPIPIGQPFTFVVLGDNRGDDSGQQPGAFFEVLDAVEPRSPAFILDTGDMIYGYTPDPTRVRDEWRIYDRAVAAHVHAPMFHVPGNHDIWDAQSGRIYRELWGRPYYAFDYGSARFIGLDTESAGGRLGEEQFQWLQQQFAASPPNLFIFLHRPLFASDGAIGSSLDEHPAERDRLHQLFVQHRDSIRGVFAGHEHLYSYEPREGVPYYISGGGGAPLYTAPELGGFHHFLVARVGTSNVEIQLVRVCAPTRQLETPLQVTPGQELENWNRGLIWYAWDRTASLELTPDRASEGNRGLRLNFDLNQYAWPVLVLPVPAALDLKHCQSLSVDVYVPREFGSSLLLTTTLERSRKFSAPPLPLSTGWNTVTTKLQPAWFSAEETTPASFQWSLSSTNARAAGHVVFDNLRANRLGADGHGKDELLDGFERPLLWRAFDESVPARIVTTNGSKVARGLKLNLDFSQCERPVAFAQLNPPWDLTKVKALLLQIAADRSLPAGLTVELCLRAKDVEYRARALPVHPGRTLAKFELNENWLPPGARLGVTQVAFRFFSTSNRPTGALTLGKLSAAPDS